MTVYPMEVSVGKKGVSQIRVISQDEKVQFIKVNLKKIILPGTPDEREVKADVNDLNNLVIAPSKIALSAGGERIVKLVTMNPPQKETTWRAYFEGVSEENAGDLSGKNGKATIGVNIVWGALIHVAPAKISPSLEINIKDNKIINTGTVRMPIIELAECSGESECEWRKISLSIYPDTRLGIKGVNFNRNKLYKVKYVNWVNNKTEEISLPVVN